MERIHLSSHHLSPLSVNERAKDVVVVVDDYDDNYFRLRKNYHRKLSLFG